jgi:hypothetical protein
MEGLHERVLLALKGLLVARLQFLLQMAWHNVVRWRRRVVSNRAVYHILYQEIILIN